MVIDITPYLKDIPKCVSEYFTYHHRNWKGGIHIGLRTYYLCYNVNNKYYYLTAYRMSDRNTLKEVEITSMTEEDFEELKIYVEEIVLNHG